jgi:hypothetical protein
MGEKTSEGKEVNPSGVGGCCNLTLGQETLFLYSILDLSNRHAVLCIKVCATLLYNRQCSRFATSPE